MSEENSKQTINQLNSLVPDTGVFYKNSRKSGRYKLSEEDKAQSISLRLHKDHIDKLSLIKGEGTAGKVRYLIDSHIHLKYREQKQAEFLGRKIDECHQALLKVTSVADPTSKKQWRERFRETLTNINALMEIYFFSPADLKEILAEKDYDRLSTILYAKEGILDG